MCNAVVKNNLKMKQNIWNLIFFCSKIVLPHIHKNVKEEKNETKIFVGIVRRRTRSSFPFLPFTFRAYLYFFFSSFSRLNFHSSLATHFSIDSIEVCSRQCSEGDAYTFGAVDRRCYGFWSIATKSTDEFDAKRCHTNEHFVFVICSSLVLNSNW